MFTLPRKFFFALEAILYIACHAGVRPVSSKEICKKHGLASRYLEPIMQHLVHEKILRGVRGPKGGYFLTKERRKITCGHIFRLMHALEQEIDAKKTSKTGDAVKTELGSLIIHPLWESLETELVTKLDAITIEDLCKQVEEKGMLSSFRNNADFVI